MISDANRRAVKRTIEHAQRACERLEGEWRPETPREEQVVTVLGAMADALAALGRAVDELDR